MNWYKKIIFAQLDQGKIQGITNYLQNLGISIDVINYILSQNEKDIQYLIGQIRKNPRITIQDIQNISIPQKIDPYLDYEKLRASNFPEIKQWVLISFRKLRQGKMPKRRVLTSTDMYDAIPEIGINCYNFDNKLSEIYDWYRAERPNIASYSPEQALESSNLWHEQSSRKGSNLIYDQINPSLIIYGPNWENTEWGGWTIQNVISENDLLVEGNRMDHCVGDYCKYVESGDSIIYSLRDPQNKPHVTIETNNENQVVQIQGNSNSDPKPIYKEMIKEWIQSGKNPGITSFEGTDDPMDEVSYQYGGTEGMLVVLNGDDPDYHSYGLTRETSYDADDIAEKAIKIENDSRDPQYSGNITDIPSATVEMLFRRHKNNSVELNRQLSLFEDALYEMEQEIYDWAMTQWEYGGDFPQEEDYETKEEFEKAEEEYREMEDDWRDEHLRMTPQGGFANDGFKIINELSQKGIYRRRASYSPPSVEKV